ncbi:MAG: hypothetical protein AB1424_12960 [Thermodesulfobacteriota bacterium]
MDFLHTYAVCASGVVLSIIIPVLSKAVRRQFDLGGAAELGGFGIIIRAIWQVIRPYIILGLFSLAVALLIVAFSGETLKTWQAALIAGYLWDSTLQKIMGKP